MESHEKALNNKSGMLGKLKGLQNTKSFGIKKGAAKEHRKRSKMKGEDLF